MKLNKLVFAGAGLFGLLAASSASAVTSEASSVFVDWGSYGAAVGSGDTAPGRYDPDSARDNVASTFFRMGIDSRALFGWGGQEITGSAVVFETTFNCTDSNADEYCDAFPERVEVYAFTNDITPAIDVGNSTYTTPDSVSRANHLFDDNFLGSGVSLGTFGNAKAQGGFSVDLSPAQASLNKIFYIMLVDTTKDLPLTQKSFDGFDIQSMAATVAAVPLLPGTVAAVPLPAGLPMLIGAVGLMGFARRYLA